MILTFNCPECGESMGLLTRKQADIGVFLCPIHGPS
jgi:hypothetical protein